MTDETASSRTRVRVWDVPTRLVHWSMVLGVGVSWWTGETGRLEWHRWSGYLLLGLVLFRLYWGLFGSATARFSTFVRGPRAVWNYLHGRWVAGPGHNPLGALSVLALLVLLAAQVVLGLFAIDVDGIESGPLSAYVSFKAGRIAAEWHGAVFKVLQWLIALHIVAIAWYRLARREKLLGAMLHGHRDFPQPVPQPAKASALRFVAGVVIAALLTWLVTRA